MKLEYTALQKELIAAITQKNAFVAVRAGWGASKTSALVFGLLYVATWRPGTSSLLVTDTAPRYRSVLGPELEKWLSPLGWTYNQLKGEWKDPNTGSSIWCRSYFRPGTKESTSNPLEGLNITSGFAFIDECQVFPSAEVAYKALGRLRSGPSPCLVMVGLPVSDAWWVKLAEQSGGRCLFYSSHVNKANLSDEWFEAVKHLPEAERLAMIENKPQPPSGLVLSEWTEGHVIDNWKYREHLQGRIAIDWGFRKPSVLIIVHDPDLNADIICGELNPREVSLDDLAQLIMAIAWPRKIKQYAPSPRIWLDDGVADKAGAARSDHSGISAFRHLGSDPPRGIGLPLKWTTDPIRTNILNGIQKLKRALARKEYLITREVWEAGDRAQGNSLRKSIMSYSWANTKDEPVKDGREDPIDALRYDCIFWRWNDDVERAMSRVKARGASRSRRVKVGGRKFIDF